MGHFIHAATAFLLPLSIQTEQAVSLSLQDCRSAQNIADDAAFVTGGRIHDQSPVIQAM
jgi:hypothetical protein